MKDNKLYQILRPVITGLMKVLYNPTITIEEEIPMNESIILAGNHVHLFDCVLLAMATERPIYFLSKKEVFKGPLKIIFESLGCIPVDRDGRDLSSIKTATDCLKDNKCIGIFPEGTRNRTDEILLPFKLGTIVIAKRGKSDIIPFAITGNYKLLKNNLHLTVGRRINIKEYQSQELLNELENQVKQMILKKQDYVR